MPAIFLLTTLYLQQGLGLAAVFAGMVTIPFALVSAYTSWISGRLVVRYGRMLVLSGLALVIVGFGLALPISAYAPVEAVPWLLSAAMIVAGAGGGFVISPNQTLTLHDVPVVQGGVAGSVQQVGQRAGTAIGVAVASSTYFATIYRETAVSPHVNVYADAFHQGLYVAIALLLVAVLFGLLDLKSRAGTEV